MYKVQIRVVSESRHPTWVATLNLLHVEYGGCHITCTTCKRTLAASQPASYSAGMPTDHTVSCVLSASVYRIQSASQSVVCLAGTFTQPTQGQLKAKTLPVEQQPVSAEMTCGTQQTGSLSVSTLHRVTWTWKADGTVHQAPVSLPCPAPAGAAGAASPRLWPQLPTHDLGYQKILFIGGSRLSCCWLGACHPWPGPLLAYHHRCDTCLLARQHASCFLPRCCCICCCLGNLLAHGVYLLARLTLRHHRETTTANHCRYTCCPLEYTGDA